MQDSTSKTHVQLASYANEILCSKVSLGSRIRKSTIYDCLNTHFCVFPKLCFKKCAGVTYYTHVPGIQ